MFFPTEGKVCAELVFVCLFLRFYAFSHGRHTQREREREAETQAEGEAGSMQGARRGTRSQVSGSHPGLQAALNRCATGAALKVFFKYFIYLRETARGNE